MPSGSARGSSLRRSQVRLDQRMVVVARHHHHLAGGRGSHHPAKLFEERARGSQRLTARAVTQLQHVAEQHQAVHISQLLQ